MYFHILELLETGIQFSLFSINKLQFMHEGGAPHMLLELV
jgi:hypothetical protein